MIECAVCEKWFHTACFNLTPEDNIDADDFVFTCPDCEKDKKHTNVKPRLANAVGKPEACAPKQQVEMESEEEPDLLATEKLILSKRPTSLLNKQPNS